MTKLLALGAALAIALGSGLAAAQSETPSTGREVNMPRFCSRHQNTERYFPSRALESGQTGTVNLDCTISNDAISTCRVADETNPGWGFGTAALAIACRYSIEHNADGSLRLSHSSPNSRLTIGQDGLTHAHIPVRFQVTVEPPPAPPHP